MDAVKMSSNILRLNKGPHNYNQYQMCSPSCNHVAYCQLIPSLKKTCTSLISHDQLTSHDTNREEG